MSKLVTLVVLVGALVFGVGAGTGWWFAVGAPTDAAPGAQASAPGESSAAGDGLFHADDLDRFVITEEQVAESIDSDVQGSLEPTTDLGWCMAGDCSNLQDAACADFVRGTISATVEPVAYKAWQVSAAAPGAPVARVDGVHAVMQYADVEQARKAYELVGVLADECVATSGTDAAVTRDTTDGGVGTLCGYVEAGPGGEPGIPWVTVILDNVVVSVRFGPNKRPTPDEFENYIGYVVEAAKAAEPVAG